MKHGLHVNINVPRVLFDIEINETFHEGITGIFGSSGSGKTSLLKAIAGIVTPKYGSIRIGSKQVFSKDKNINLPIQKRDIGYVFQEGRLFPHLNILKNLQYAYADKDTAFFKEIISLLNIQNLLQAMPHEISGGEKQRVALGRALLMSPKLLLLDEPFSALDGSIRNQIIQYITKIQEYLPIPILIVSHDFQDLLKLTNTLFFIKNGKCIAHGLYNNIISHKEIHTHFSDFSFMNVLNLEVFAHHPSLAVTILHIPSSNEAITIVNNNALQHYSIGQKVSIMLSPEDISLSTNKIENISIQNQLPGTIERVFFIQSRVRCIVNIGVLIIVEISIASYKRLDFTINSSVWCLFKSAAIYSA
ncbi:MAG: molybdenum ABC transporter ATP-binding protein [Bacteroidota bacterium]